MVAIGADKKLGEFTFTIMEFDEEDMTEIPEEFKEDKINPSHYTSGGIETFDYMKAKLTPQELEGFLKGNILKYISRANLKNGKEDYNKAKWYLDKLVEL